MKRIQLLSENLINQIAAGEVVERPASVVKELVENCIDANSTRIEVEISNDCRNIRVADNGHGIHKDDVVLAFSRHATSKISKTSELFTVSTLGFRGEALASIISISKVTCTSRTADSETGIKVDCKESEVKVSETGCAVGTIMDVQDLFYNVPARLKFLKKAQTELSVISETLQNLALSHPEISFNLIHNKNSILKTSGSGSLETTICEIHTKSLLTDLNSVYMDDKDYGLVISGFVSGPAFTRSNKKGIYTFINGRMIKCPVIIKALDTAYRDMIPSGRYPFAVLNLTIPHKEVDINVHPSKREVKYTKPNLIFNFVKSSARAALLKENILSRQVESEPESNFQLDINTEPSSVLPESQKLTGYNQFEAVESIDFSKFVNKKEEFSSIPAKKEILAIEQTQNQIGLNIPKGQGKEVEKLKIIGQLKNTYILIESEKGLQVVDQHIAHERYLYEKLLSEKNPAAQYLLASDIVYLEPEQAELIFSNMEVLEKFGYEFEIVEQQSSEKTLNENAIALQAPVDKEISLNLALGVKLKRVPAMLSQENPEKIIYELLDVFESSPGKIEEKILITTACRAAVKAGEQLTHWQMEELIRNWQETKFPQTCPHGRTISHTIPTKEIAKFFGRAE